MKNILFDYGNTLGSFEPYEIVKSFGVAGDDAKLLSDIIFSRNYFDKLDSGELSQQAFKDAVAKEVPSELKEIALLICDDWGTHLPVISGMGKLVEKLKKAGFGLYILSNISAHFADNYKKIWIFKYFDGFVFSGKIRAVKPSSDFFQSFFDMYKLNVSDCVFLDDSEYNVENAKKFGIKSYLFDGDANLAEAFIKENFGDF